MSAIIKRLHLIRAASQAGNLNGYEGLILRELSDRIGDRNTTEGWFIKQDDLAADCGISVKTANRTIGKLVRRGLVLTEDRGQRKSLRYYIDESKLAALGQGGTVSQTQSTSPSPAKAQSTSPSGLSQRVLAGTVNESYWHSQRVPTDSSQLLPKTPPDETPPNAREISSDPELDEQGVAMTPVEAMITSISQRLPKSAESVSELKELWHGGIRQRLQAMSPASKSTDLLEMVDIAADEEFGGRCSLGAIFGDPARLERLMDSIQAQILAVEEILDSKASSVARGLFTLDEVKARYSPTEAAYIERKAIEKAEAQARIDAQHEANIAAQMAAWETANA